MHGNAVARGLLAAALLATFGCATSKGLTRDQALQHYPRVAELENRLAQAREGEMDLFAQAAFAQALAAQKSADRAAAKDDPTAGQIAREGLRALDEAALVTTRAQDVFEEVLAVRARALKAGASRGNGDFVDAEKGLARAAAVLERGQTERAKEARPELIQAYRAVELAVIKAGTIGQAQQAIGNAAEAGARRYAPRTLAMAEQEMALALSVLDANRDDRAKADQNARNAVYLAARATAISDLAQQFERRDYTAEDMILWYQGQLETVAQPLGTPLRFDLEDKRVVRALRGEVAALAARAQKAEADLDAGRAELGRTRAEAAQRVAAEELAAVEERLKGELGSIEAQHAAERQRRAEAQSRLDMVQSLFTEDEAEVLRKRDDILIRAYGFYFPVGQSEIDSRNFELLRKIVTAIETYPGSDVEVSGHTDITGSRELNQRLSAERAEKVTKFLAEMGRIDVGRIHAEGFGPDRPVAANTTPEGRAANRRVEILIQPVR